MEGVIVNFRGGRHTQKNNQMIITVGQLTNDKAEELVGKKVTWKNEKGNAIVGKISGVHGNKGALKSIFEKGMPGQSVGTKVSIE